MRSAVARAGAGDEGGRVGEQRVVDRALGGGDVNAVGGTLDADAGEEPADALLGGVAALLLAPPALRFRAGGAVEGDELLVGDVAIEGREQPADRRLAEGAPLGSGGARVDRVPLIEGDGAQSHRSRPAVGAAALPNAAGGRAGSGW